MAQNVEYYGEPIYATKAKSLAAPESLDVSLTRDFVYANNDLDEIVATIRARLSCVLQPEYDCAPGLSDPALDVSELRRELYRLHEATAALRVVLARIEA